MSVQSIDFKYIRQHADIGSVLAAYGVTLTKDGSKAEVSLSRLDVR